MLAIVLSALNSIAAVVIVLGLCLMVHETGHMLIAKLCKMRVDEFAFGFGPSILRFQRGETVYRLNIIPFGAYVRIAGMEPGSEDTPRGFYTRPRWMGFSVIVAGSIFNLVLAIVIFTSVTLWVGLPDPTDRGIYVGKLAADSPAGEAGIAPGDEIIAVDGARHSLIITEVADDSPAAEAGITRGMYVEKVGGREVYVAREMLEIMQNAEEETVTAAVIDPSERELTSQQRFIAFPVTDEIRAAASEEAPEVLAESLGLTFGRLNQTTLVGYVNMRPNKTVVVSVRRDGAELDIPVLTTTSFSRVLVRHRDGTISTPHRQVGRIGVVLRSASRAVNFGEALQSGWQSTKGSVQIVLLSIRGILLKHMEPDLAGPVAIMAISMEHAKVGWDAVLNWGGIISAILAVMNLLPIPPFDGFKAVVIAWEGIIRRRIDSRKEIILSITGFILVLFAFFLLTFKDIVNLVRYGTP